MDRILGFLQTQLDRIAPKPQRRLTNMHHFVCCGLLHVKFATMIAIIIRLVVIVYLTISMMFGNYYINYWLNVVYQATELVTFICLVVGYLKQESKWMLPYMAVEFAWLVIALITYVVALSMLLYPQNFYNWLIPIDESTSSGSKSQAFWTAIRTLIASLLISTELSILLACTRYFDDEKERLKEPRERPIILSTNEETRNNTVVFMDEVPNSDENNQISSNPNTNSTEATTSGFLNSNFSLENDSEDEIDENDWHRKGKKTNVLK